MRLEEAFFRVLDVESRGIGDNLSWHSVKMWPLVRQCLWLEFTQVKAKTGEKPSGGRSSRFKKRFSDGVSAVSLAFRNWPTPNEVETTAFISRPEYLQELPNGELFDRIVDPLISCMPNNVIHSKYYLAKWPKKSKLHYLATLLRPGLQPRIKVPEAHRNAVARVACAAGIEPQRLLSRYTRNLRAFDRWYRAGQKLFKGKRNLKTLYVTSWYFPDMMGLIAAASEKGIRTVDVQHGKQGKFQAMYSGWRIPEEGYQMMPAVFWCWGKPSAEHILATSPNRQSHRPVVGGYPWLDYYRRHISSKKEAGRRSTKKYVLVTIQPLQADNIEPIPDFFIEVLRKRPEGVQFIFRCHPNDKSGLEYCSRRLFDLASDLCEIDPGRCNLYDQLAISTHHITAYSSCCYEAQIFGVPTLLFGVDAKNIYKDEIERGLFSWTPGNARDLESWLETPSTNLDETNSDYIVSSLDRAATICEMATSGNFEYHNSDPLMPQSLHVPKAAGIE